MEEMLDLVNEKDEITGKAARKEVNEKGLLYRCVGVYVFRNEKIIVEQRSKNKKIRPMNYSIVEETVQLGESYASAAIRGVKEELNVEAKELKPLTKKLIRDTKYPDNFIMQFYTCKTDAKPKIDSLELNKIEELTLDELKKLTQNNRNVITPSLLETIHLIK